MTLKNETARPQDSLLATYACFSHRSKGRKHSEEDANGDVRTKFQRDVGRITHSYSFRSLQYKTQVFYQPDDFTRTRLTHTLAVSQIARTLARVFKVNEDLTEAIALAHDMGHPPFGHVGEEVLSRLLAESGGFEHNEQSLRTVDLLEFRCSDYPGLNLTYEVREGLAMHKTEYDKPRTSGEFDGLRQPSVEAQIVNIADTIAYRSHDLEDGFALGLISPDDLEKDAPELWKNCLPTASDSSYADLVIGAPRRLIRQLIQDVISESTPLIADSGAQTVEDIRQMDSPIIQLSEKTRLEDGLLGNFLLSRLYLHEFVVKNRKIAEESIPVVFHFLKDHPEHVHSNDTSPLETRICDTICSLTDRAIVNSSSLIAEGKEPEELLERVDYH